jgi:SAM-dependent methyltransferase
VLDAGAGSGSFLPALAELVGPSGAVTALDAAPENVALVEERIASAPLACPIDVREGSVAALPWSDASFDAVWCANVLQYFSDQELPGVITELRRVVRPGGLVAVKDVDMTLFRFHPADPFLVTHLSEASIRAAGAAWSEGSLRARTLRRHLEAGGLSDVWQRTTLIERWAPLAPAERRLWTEWLAFLATLAEERGVPDADLPTWRALRDAEASPSPVDQPDFYACEGQVVAVGIR